MAVQKRRRPPRRDAGGDLRNERLGGGLDTTHTKSAFNLQRLRGLHRAQIIASRILEAGEEKAVELTFSIEDGAPVKSSIRYRSADEKAQAAGQRALAELCAACGHRGPLESAEILHGISIGMHLKRVAGGLRIDRVERAPPPLGDAPLWPAAAAVIGEGRR